VSGPYDDGAEFERIVSRFWHAEPVGDAESEAPSRARPVKLRMRNEVFAGVSLAVIVPLSMIVGGWLGLAAAVVSTFVAVRLIRDR
jgi:hypothetical protein